MIATMANALQGLVVTIDTDEAVAKLMALRSEIEETASHLRMLRDEANLTAAAMSKAATVARMAAEELALHAPTEAEEAPAP